MNKKKKLGRIVIMLLLFSFICPFTVSGTEPNTKSVRNKGGSFSLAVNNQALGEVFENISKQTGYLILYDEEWGDFPISIFLNNVDLDRGLEKILKSHDINYFISYDYNDKEIVIDIAGCNSAQSNLKDSGMTEIPAIQTSKENHQESETDFTKEADNGTLPPWEMEKNRDDDEETELMDLELVPSDEDEDEDGESGITPRELIEMRKAEKEVDFSELELVPPDEDGGRGITERELKRIRKDEQDIDATDQELIPPEEN